MLIADSTPASATPTTTMNTSSSIRLRPRARRREARSVYEAGLTFHFHGREAVHRDGHGGRGATERIELKGRGARRERDALDAGLVRAAAGAVGRGQRQRHRERTSAAERRGGRFRRVG